MSQWRCTAVSATVRHSFQPRSKLIHVVSVPRTAGALLSTTPTFEASATAGSIRAATTVPRPHCTGETLLAETTLQSTRTWTGPRRVCSRRTRFMSVPSAHASCQGYLLNSMVLRKGFQLSSVSPNMLDAVRGLFADRDQVLQKPRYTSNP